ncbi:MAG: 5-deoxy-glucuronate isomerase [Christensenellales bacterium]|jgi:5-deoxy-glucuronate isomerase
MLKKLEVKRSGYHIITEENGAYAFTQMDTGLEIIPAGESKVYESGSKETAFLLLTGELSLRTSNGKYEAKRKSIFTERPYCLHIPRGVKAELTAGDTSELLIISTINERIFPEVWYTPGDVQDRFLGEGVWEGCAKRLIRDIFTYDNAPYSNLVVGEIINLPGRWSSYAPHWHRQPEIYYYRFDKPQGFGACFIGDDAHTIRDNSFAAIPGGLCHPQVAAPGYAMYYAWIIRHLDNDPWNERIMDPAHEWLNERGAEVLKLG